MTPTTTTVLEIRLAVLSVLSAELVEHRWHLFFTEVLKTYWKVQDDWFRLKWQKRGSGHVRGFLWLAGQPDG